MRLSCTILAIAFICAALWVNTGIIYNEVFYVLDTYDCSNMSDDQADFFESIGFTVYKKSGYYNDTDIGHSWIEIDVFGVRVPWESTFLLPVSPAWVKNYDIIKDRTYG